MESSVISNEFAVQGALQTLSSTKYLMKTSGPPVDEAMAALGIPDAEQSRYAKLLEQ